jgi:hypothetical protein
VTKAQDFSGMMNVNRLLLGWKKRWHLQVGNTTMQMHYHGDLQASTLTYFSTCPFGQLTKKSTCPTQSFSFPKKFIKITKTRE